MRLLLLAHFLVLLTACSADDEIPRDVLPREKMQKVLGDMIGAGEWLEGYILKKDTTDSFATRSLVYSKVLQVNHISREEFDRSLRFYREHPVLMKELLDTLNKRLTTLPIVAPPQAKPVVKDSVAQ